MTHAESKENVRLRAMRGLVICLTVLACLLTSCSTPSPTAGVRMNQIQVIGTHNSYHQRMHDSLMELVRRTHPDAVQELDYWHRPLTQQLEDLNIRQVELDCYVDTEGGRFANPIGPKKAAELGLPPIPSNDPDGKLLKPGIKVMHIPDIDFGTSVLTLVDGLKEVRAWSLAHPRHVPVFILIELKDETLGAGFTQALPWDATQLADLERTILSVFPRREIVMPDDVRGSEASLPEAIHKHGWPMLDSVRGKVMFGMDNEGTERTIYLTGHPALEGRILFVSETPDNPAAAWMKRNDPINQFDEIQTLVREGFLVRTRADEPNGQARNNDTRMRDHALASGAQFVSTDYPEPNLKLSPYRVSFPDGGAVRSNPLIGPPDISGQDLEPR